MAQIVKPIYTQEDIWGVEGDKVQPPIDKIKNGWGHEMMPAEYENWIQNRQDQALAYLYQFGIPEWDALTEYIANKSFVQHNGKIYLALVTNYNVTPTDSPTWKDIIASGSTQKPLVASFGFTKKVKGVAQEIDPKTASVFEVPLSVPETEINIINISESTPAARQITLILTQDSVGARLVKWPTNVRWASAIPPVLSFLPNRTDVVTLLSTDNGATWYGFTSGGFFISN